METKKALIIFGSPRSNGDTAFLVNFFKKNYNGEIKILNVFKPFQNSSAQLSPCLDCRACTKLEGCAIKDNLMQILSDDYDAVLIASPLYMSNLPAPMFSLISRVNYIYNNKLHLNKQHLFCQKKAGLILVGGGGANKTLMGKSNEDMAIRQAKYIFKKLNASLDENNIVLALNTDRLSVKENYEAQNKVIEIARTINGG